MKHIHAKDFRRAFRAIAALRERHDPALAQAIGRLAVPDEQRRFQSLVAAIVAADGVAGLARRWPELPLPEWRARLISEIGQFLAEWSDPRLIEVFMAALNDPEAAVMGQAVAFLHQVLRQPTDKERREARRTRSRPVYLAAGDAFRESLSPADRARIAQRVLAMLVRHAGEPRGLLWFAWYVELLGQTADRTNGAAIALLERLRTVAGEPHVVRFERLTAQDLTPPERVLAERRGVTPVARISHIPTGVLDAGVVEAALEAIRRREPPGG